jgi:tetratricopeptide (TPR) repeat protein
MATVWLARDLKHDRLVAIKLLRPELGDVSGAARFASEIGIVAKLNHPNILGVIDSGIVEAEGRAAPYYVMPHVEGPSLSALLAQGEKLSVNEALRLAAEVADALAFAHSRGIVHRDIKPGNILIQAGHALVADFGVAIALDAATVGGRHHTQAGQIMGTPVYMSPEQASGATRMDGRSDLYSLGCVLYEMLAGAPPFGATTPQAMIVAHLGTPPPPLASRRPDLPPGVAATVHRALEKMPEARFATASEFRDALERHRSSIGVRRRWWPTAALVAAVALLFWLAPWRSRAGHAGPGSDVVVLLSGFRDRTGTLRAEAAALDDALRSELQAVPGIRVIDAGDQPEVPVDTLRGRYGADWIIRASVDKVGDSIGATIRVIDASNGAEVRSGLLRQASAGALQAAAVAYPAGSLFSVVRSAMDSIVLDRWLASLGPDTATADLRQRARVIRGRSGDALVTVGPRRMLEDLDQADSLLALAEARSPSSALPAYERASLGILTGFQVLAARQTFPDSAWLPASDAMFRRALPSADVAVMRAPNAADAWFIRSQLYQWLLMVTQDPSWRDLALRDLRKATALAGSRPDIWRERAVTELASGQYRDALFSAQQGEAVDYLHVNGADLRYRRSYAEMALGMYDKASESCRSGAREFPGSAYFVTCEAEVLGRSSARATDADMVLRLSDSLARSAEGRLTPIVVDELRLFAAAILARSGQQERAARTYETATARWSGAVDPVLLLDAVYARQMMGDPDSALVMAARVVRQDSATAANIEREPWYQELRRDPGFPAAMKGISPGETQRR